MVRAQRTSEEFPERGRKLDNYSIQLVSLLNLESVFEVNYHLSKYKAAIKIYHPNQNTRERI